jgi:hypothetical protein
MGSTDACRDELSGGGIFDVVACEACTLAVQVGADGTIVTAQGDRGRVTYADEALLVWECPRCQVTNAEDRLG